MTAADQTGGAPRAAQANATRTPRSTRDTSQTPRSQSGSHQRPAREFTLEETERAVAARLGETEIDMPSMAVVSNIYRAAHSVRNLLERTVLAPHGLTWTGWVVLWVVWVWGQVESSRAAREAGISKSTLTGVADTLTAKGLLDRSVHPEDARRVLLSLTPEGEALMAAVFGKFNDVEKLVTSDLSSQSKTQVAQALRAIIKRIDAPHGHVDSPRS